MVAHAEAVSPFKIGTVTASGDPVMPALVTVTVTSPDADAVPAAVAVSTCATPVTNAVEPVEWPVVNASANVGAPAAKNARTE